MPRQKVGEPFPDSVLLPKFVSEERGMQGNPIPWDKGEIGIGAASVNNISTVTRWVHSQFVSNEVLSILEDVIQDTKYPDNLLNVPALRSRDVF